MLLNELFNKTKGIFHLDTTSLNEGKSIYKVGIGTLYVFWSIANNQYVVDKITGDEEGKEVLNHDELDDYVAIELHKEDPAQLNRQVA